MLYMLDERQIAVAIGPDIVGRVADQHSYGLL